MTVLDRLTGDLCLLPGRPMPHNLHRRRPAAVERMLAQQPVALWPELVASVFSLCGHAQRGTARRAIAAACGVLEQPDAGQRRLLRWHTAREHARHMLLDWQAPGSAQAAQAQQLLARCPLFALRDPGQALRALPQWLAREVLGTPVQVWLQALEAGGEFWLQAWAASADGPVALALQSVRPQAQALTLACVPLRLEADLDMRWALASQLAGPEPASLDEVMAPLAGTGVETGAWAREGLLGHAGVHNAWMRWAGRLIDLVRLAADEDNRWLCCSAATVGHGRGMAWTETARGLLVHWVQLDGERVVRARIVSPTDWNFHPQGPVARLLPGLDAAGAQCVAQAFDPCVPLRIAQQEPAHA